VSAQVDPVIAGHSSPGRFVRDTSYVSAQVDPVIAGHSSPGRFVRETNYVSALNGGVR
jgi:hypothetical protein